jgi:poly-gamma-glutamate synthesis protein (capsule biosynthesis protein)
MAKAVCTNFLRGFLVIWGILFPLGISVAIQTDDTVLLTGRVVGLDGQPIDGATAQTASDRATSGSDGWFEVVGEPNPQWITVDHPDFLSRTRAAAPESPVLFRLTPDDGQPIMIENYVPKGVTGDLADFVARGAAGREPGAFIIENGAMEVDLHGMAAQQTVTHSVVGDPAMGTIAPLPREVWVSGFSGDGTIRLGRDLLWTGRFEDEDVDSERFEGALWNTAGDSRLVAPNLGHNGSVGAQLLRDANNQSDVVLSPSSRIRIEPGTELSVTGMVRASASASLAMQLSWYPDTSGPSSQQTIEPISINQGDAWQSFRFDATAPTDTVAVGLFLRLTPPGRSRVTADFDNLHLITWDEIDALMGRRYTHVRIAGSGDLTFTQDILPGGLHTAVPPANTQRQP